MKYCGLRLTGYDLAILRALYRHGPMKRWDLAKEVRDIMHRPKEDTMEIYSHIIRKKRGRLGMLEKYGFVGGEGEKWLLTWRGILLSMRLFPHESPHEEYLESAWAGPVFVGSEFYSEIDMERVYIDVGNKQPILNKYLLEIMKVIVSKNDGEAYICGYKNIIEKVLALFVRHYNNQPIDEDVKRILDEMVEKHKLIYLKAVNRGYEVLETLYYNLEKLMMKRKNVWNELSLYEEGEED